MTGSPRTRLRLAPWHLTLLAGTALLGACVSAADCDPARTNLLSAAACQNAGLDVQRQQALERQALLREADVTSLRLELSALEARRASQAREIRSLEQRVADLDRSLAEFAGLLDRARRTEGASQAELALAQSRLDQLRRARADVLAGPVTDTDVTALEEEADEAFEILDVLIGG